MIKREANFGILFRHYLKAHPLQRTTWFELKQTREQYLSFKAVKDHQLAWLLACKHGVTNYKIPDDSRGIKPVDGIFSRETDAIVVIRYPSCFCIIDVDDFIRQKNNDPKVRGLTMEIAQKIAQRVVIL